MGLLDYVGNDAIGEDDDEIVGVHPLQSFTRLVDTPGAATYKLYLVFIHALDNRAVLDFIPMRDPNVGIGNCIFDDSVNYARIGQRETLDDFLMALVGGRLELLDVEFTRNDAFFLEFDVDVVEEENVISPSVN